MLQDHMFFPFVRTSCVIVSKSQVCGLHCLLLEHGRCWADGALNNTTKELGDWPSFEMNFPSLSLYEVKQFKVNDAKLSLL